MIIDLIWLTQMLAKVGLKLHFVFLKKPIPGFDIRLPVAIRILRNKDE